MCEFCNMSNPKWGDFSERFEFEKESLDYYDGPISGWVQCRRCHEGYAFYCSTIIASLLWHWSLVKVEMKNAFPVSQIFEEFRTQSNMKWLSVVEDRRHSRNSICYGAWIDDASTLPRIL